jgi:hypothetical protein
MDIISAYREAGTFRGAAVISGTTHKTVTDRNFRRLVAVPKQARRREHHRGRPAAGYAIRALS